MWTNAFNNLEPPPHPPLDSTNEPAYATLLFDSSCSVVVGRVFKPHLKCLL